MNSLSFAAVSAAGCLIAVGTLKLCSGSGTNDEPVARFAPIDGLRGFAAFAVFLDHSAGWHTFAIDGRWDAVAALANVSGPIAVSLFFMVTAFLFVEKVVFSPRPTDWLRLATSRLLRMLPLFLVAFALVLAIVATETTGIRESPARLLKHIGQWLPLTLFGSPDINGLHKTWMTVAGVTWTLPYECLFYLALPAIATCSGRRVGLPILLGCSAAFLGVLFCCILPAAGGQLVFERLLAFPAGAVAAALVQSLRWGQWARGPIATGVAIASGLLALFLAIRHHTAWHVPFSGFAFAIVAAGNPLLGVLTGRSARLLGQISYSIYLLHGLMLYSILRLALGLQVVAAMPEPLYWVLILAMVPVLVLGSLLSYRCIELPGIARTDRWTVVLRRLLSSGPRRRLNEAPKT